MMEEHIGADRLHDHVDGLLPPAEAGRVAAHLAACASCAAEAEAIRALRAALAGLPPRRDPGRDLRPGIRALRVRAAERGRVRLAAAALVVVGAGLTALVLSSFPASDTPRPIASGAPGAAGDADAPAAMVLTLDREYDRAGEELKARIEESMARPRSDAARLLAGDLAAVERALAESRAALREDPTSPVVRELVLAAHRQRLDVLRRAAAVASETEEAS